MTHEFDETPEFSDSMTFGEIIRKKRRLMGLNQTDFGKYLCLRQKQISGWETGRSQPSIEEAKIVMNILGFDFVIRERNGEQQFIF